jgi:transposase
MAKYTANAWKGKHLFVGIDIHRKKWHVTVRSEEGLILFRNSIDGSWSALCSVLHRFSAAKKISAVYEAGYFGFWLYDHLVEYGVDAKVTPPNLIPSATGNKVKNDRLDSNRLAELLQAGLLKSVHVPTPQERAHRQVARRRRQLIQDRVRTQNRIKAELRLNEIELSHESKGRWSHRFVHQLRQLQFPDPWQQRSFEILLDELSFLSDKIAELTGLLKEMAQEETYRERIEILTSIPGMGWLSALEILLELQDVQRFQRADQLAAYIGLTPSQYSSGEHTRLGRITRQGRPAIRMLLIQMAWTLIVKDGAMREKYERIKANAGGKRAIVAIARTLLIRMRRLLLDREPYVVGLVSG